MAFTVMSILGRRGRRPAHAAQLVAICPRYGLGWTDTASSFRLGGRLEKLVNPVPPQRQEEGGKSGTGVAGTQEQVECAEEGPLRLFQSVIGRGVER